ncbi:MAG: hypothetical protein R8K50_00060 [Mariprofundus sp.]
MNHTDGFRESLGSMKQWAPMLELIESDQLEELTAASIEDVWNNFKETLHTNCDSAADALMAALSSVCSRRPLMLEKLLPDALEPLTMLGLEEVSEVQNWATRFTEREDLYLGKPDQQSIAWILAVLIHSEDKIKFALNQQVRMNHAGR